MLITICNADTKRDPELRARVNAPLVALAHERAATSMTLAERIAHVGGRITEAGYVEFGSAMAVDALILHVLRDARAESANQTGTQGATAEAATLLRQARDELSLVEWENDPPNRVQALFDRIEAYVSRGPAQAAEPVALPQPVLDALRFYANGHHFDIDAEHQQFDTVSGEPVNWLFSERDDDCTMIEDGSIAKAALCGGMLGFEEPETPLEGEVFAAAPQRPVRADARDHVADARNMVDVRVLTDEQRDAITAMIDLTRATFIALDDSEEQEGSDGWQHVINSTNFDAVSNALDRLEELPDDKPGETLNAAGKAEWALRALLAAHPGQPEPREAILYAHDDGRYAVAPSAEAADFTRDEPAWHRVGPVAVYGFAGVLPEPCAEVTDAMRDVLAERHRQIEQEGHSHEDDDIYNDQGQLSYAAAGLAVLASNAATDIVCGLTGGLTYADHCIGSPEPWPHEWQYKPATPRRNLVKAAAMIVAEIERIDRSGGDQ
ncbi:hypothetical protein [Burkholderia vietnamiensis]|uniref:hypothetical protein n=1 Tax=Burkholderia vietnamiensis TaxID=60552 RepID=UPI001590EAEB|nr:hypothetical protein [Burkholderia vietnamiensis]